MAFNNDDLKKSFQSLSTRYGGSLLKEKTLLEQKDVTVFIGLGGLGCKTINAIKATTNEKLNNAERRFFLTVDTCESDMDGISAVLPEDLKNPEEAEGKSRGVIEEHEKLPLYSTEYYIKELGVDVDSWINRAVLGETKIDNKGAQGIRQIGRIMLMANGNYERVYARLSEVLGKAKDVADAKNVSIRIYIVAGISGGTGSGTIVDFAYMVKRAVSGFEEKYKNLEAIIFTPDVQYNEKGIGSDKQKGLRANFYAAMKEIDFFFNNKAKRTFYQCPYTNDEPVYHEDIFDFCTIVSRRAEGVDVSYTASGVIQRVADALAFEISGMCTDQANGGQQSFVANQSNIHNNFSHWWPDNTKGKGVNLPDWAPPRYSSFAYSSFYVPRDELVVYCADLLMEKLADHWKQRDITEEELQNIFRENHIGSNKAFAGKLFGIVNGSDLFEVENAELPTDGWGPAKVKNCASYLNRMREIAMQEGSSQRVKKLIKRARNSQNNVFVDPIISLVDKAFLSEEKGPVYAINLLSAGISREYTGKSGILAWIKKLLSEQAGDASTWALELEQEHANLSVKAEAMDGQISVDAGELASFTDSCRSYGEKLLKCKILEVAREYLEEIYNKLNDKNERVFSIYTYAFEYLVDTIKKDAEYVADTNRHREGQTTIFTFDVTDFKDDEESSKRFKTFFESYVDTKNIDEQSKTFVNTIFGQLKNMFDPAVPTEETQTVQPEAVIEVIRNFFKTSFTEFTDEVVEQFCVVAYSDVEATAEEITKAWKDKSKKDFALQQAATAITGKIVSRRNIMLTCGDISKPLKNFSAFSLIGALENTPGIKGKIQGAATLQADWSEFIGFQRIYGFPIALLDDIELFKEEYDKQAVGMHLDEMFGPDEEFGDWRYSFPELYSYKVARLLGKYTEGGTDCTERDRNQMTELFELAEKAKRLGILIAKNSDGTLANDLQNPGVYYELVSSLVKPIEDFAGARQSIYDNIRIAARSFISENRSLDFFSVITAAGYKPAEGENIQWTFARPEYNVMQNQTDFGDTVDFGNFIVLLRSNPYWGAHLKNGVETFGKLHEIYRTVLSEFEAASLYKDRVVEFMRAIRVGRVVPFVDNGIFSGYKIKVSEKKEDEFVFTNAGLDVLDKAFLIYHCFTEAYMTLDAEKVLSMTTLVNREFDMRVDYTNEARENVDYFIKEVEKVLNDEEYLAHYDAKTLKKKFEEKLKYSKFNYSLPNPSNNRENIDAIIKNLKEFFVEVRDYLTENRVDSAVGVVQEEKIAVKPVPSGTANSWVCSYCGTSNTGKFCQNCGNPAPTGSWVCSRCGASNTGKFCQECGNPRTDKTGCPKCGWVPESGTNVKFCQECGTKMG